MGRETGAEGDFTTGQVQPAEAKDYYLPGSPAGCSMNPPDKGIAADSLVCRGKVDKAGSQKVVVCLLPFSQAGSHERVNGKAQ